MKALADVTVLDFSHLLQGPFAAQLLGDMGANVIKVERPGAGDLFRAFTFNNQWLPGGESPNFMAWNRNKRSLALDLKASDAAGVVEQLVRKADVLIQNFRPGVMDRLGYGYEALAQMNPRLIYCSGSGYGDDGPYLDRPGQDMLIQGLTGLMAATGRSDGPPTPVGAGFADQVGAMNMVYGIMTALYARERTGMGQHVKVDLLSGLLAHQGQEMLTVMNFGRDFQRPASGIGHPGMDAPFGVYPASDGWLTIAMSPFRTLIDILDAPELAIHDSPQALFEQRDEIWALIANRTRAWKRADLLAKLLAADIWCGEVKTHSEAAEDAQVVHRGLIQTMDHLTAGKVRVVGPAVRMSATPAAIDRAPPVVGQHTREILVEFGFVPDEVDRLMAGGAVVQADTANVAVVSATPESADA